MLEELLTWLQDRSYLLVHFKLQRAEEGEEPWQADIYFISSVGENVEFRSNSRSATGALHELTEQMEDWEKDH